MPFERPTLTEIIDQTEAEVASRFGLAQLIPRGPLAALSRVVSLMRHALHGHLDFAAAQRFPQTAVSLDLDRLAELRSIARKPAIASTGTVTFTGTSGTDVPAGTQIERADGRTYTTDALATIAGVSVSIGVTAVQAGLDGDSPTGTVLTLSTPIPNVDNDATVDAPGLANGADRETDEELRVRVVDDWRSPKQGGADADYVAWASSVPEVTRVFVHPVFQAEAGKVGVSFAVDNDPTGPIPDAAKVAEVDAVIQDLRPVTAQVSVFAPTEATLDPEIALVPDTGAIRAAVAANIEALLISEAVPGGTLTRNQLIEAIGTAPGEVTHTLISPAGDVPIATTELLTLGTVTWS